MKLANIVYEAELINHTKVEYVNYINEATEYDKLDKTLPTLYVGWSFMKLCNPNNEIVQNANILHRRIVANDLYWECSFAEGKASHVNGVENFIKAAPQFYFSSKYTYVNLDPIFFQLRDVDDLMDVVPKRIDVSYNYKNEMLYLLSSNKITGINLLLYNYFKFNVNSIIERIAERTEIGIVDEEGTSYQQYYKMFPEYVHLKRHMVTFFK